MHDTALPSIYIQDVSSDVIDKSLPHLLFCPSDNHQSESEDSVATVHEHSPLRPSHDEQYLTDFAARGGRFYENPPSLSRAVSLAPEINATEERKVTKGGMRSQADRLSTKATSPVESNSGPVVCVRVRRTYKHLHHCVQNTAKCFQRFTITRVISSFKSPRNTT